jgi:Holliday junction resolvase RusA-like endonuclease
VKKIKIKPLSINKAWQGKRFKTNDYKGYEQELFYLLPKLTIPKSKLKLKLIFGFSNKSSDLDNPIKPFVDILQKKYNFNDKRIYQMTIEKKDVYKGGEFISFELSTF